MKTTTNHWWLVVVAALLLGGCGGGLSVKRVETDTEVALTDRWNDEDSRLVAEAMIEDMLTFPWLRDFSDDHPNRRPTIIIQRVRNKSHEHIATDTFLNDLKRALMRSGRADFVAGGKEREDVREELRSQDVYASEDSRKEMGEELGADFALSGTISSIVDQYEGSKVIFYQVDLKLIDLQTTREVWNGQKKLKKVSERSRFGF